MKKLGSEIGFDDSEFKSCEINKDNSNTIIVYLNSWDGHIIKIMFLHTIQFSFTWGHDVTGVYEMNEDSFFKEAVSGWYGNNGIPVEQPFKKFSIIDIDDIEFIEVVAEQVIVLKELQH